jgi:hypothetical protein
VRDVLINAAPTNAVQYVRELAYTARRRRNAEAVSPPPRQTGMAISFGGQQ